MPVGKTGPLMLRMDSDGTIKRLEVLREGFSDSGMNGFSIQVSKVAVLSVVEIDVSFLKTIAAPMLKKCRIFPFKV